MREGSCAQARSAKAAQYRERLLPTIEAIKARGTTTQHGTAEQLNRREITAPRGSLWSQVQVVRLCKRELSDAFLHFELIDLPAPLQYWAFSP
jgi:hypothetical protein